MAGHVTNPDEANRRRLESALSEFALTLSRGTPIDPDEFCRTHSDCGRELRAAIDGLLSGASAAKPQTGVAAQVPAAPARDQPAACAPATTVRLLPDVIGDFRILRELGRGGMGVVYEAEQLSLNRRVALKLLAPHLGVSTDQVLKFRREAEAEGRQSHPGIVAIYAVGEQDGVHYIAQELIEGGRTLADKFREASAASQLPRGYFREIASLFAQVADALGHAHANGVIHRDIKPSNILLTRDETPKVTDFGLAKIESVLALTRTGEFEGTPYYMSPEQIVRKKGGIDQRSDIYSLGVTLYEALTLKRPFDGESSLDVLRKVIQEEPVNPRRTNPKVPWDLAVICQKAMEKHPLARYQTMAEFGADLRRWLAGEAIAARAAGPATRSFKWARRHRAITVPILIALSLALVASAVLLQKNIRESRAFGNLMDRADAAAKEGRWNEAVDQLVRALSIRPNDPRVQDRHRLYLQEKELAAVKAERDEKENALRRSEGLRLSEESAKLLEANPGLALIIGLEGAKRFPSLVTRNAVGEALEVCRERRTMFIRRYPYLPEVQETDRGLARTVDISPDGTRLVSCAWDATPAVWDATTGERLVTLALPASTRNRPVRTWYGVFRPDGKAIALAGNSPQAWIFDAGSGAVIAELGGHTIQSTFATFDRSGRLLATAAVDSTIRIWDATSGEQLHVLRGHTNQVVHLCFSPDGRLLASGAGDYTARIWDTQTGREVRVLPGHEDDVRSVCFSPDGRVLAAADDQSLRVWDVATGRMLCVIRGLYNKGSRVISVWGIEFSPDGSRLTTTWGDAIARVWSVATGEEVLQLRGHQGIIRSIHFSPDGTRIVTGAFDNTARIWDSRTGAELAVLRGHKDFLHDARFLPDSRRVVTISEDSTVRIWDAQGAAPRETCVSEPVQRLFFDEGGHIAADGRRLEIGAIDTSTTVVVRSPETAQRKRITLRHSHPVIGGRFSAGDTRILTTSIEKMTGLGWIHVWDANTAKELRVITEGLGTSFCGANLMNDGRDLVATGGGGLLGVWDAVSGAEKFVTSGHARWILAASYSRDRSKLATASADGTARVWKAATGEALAVLRGHEGEVTAALFSPDARRVLTVADDHTARVWDAETGEEIRTLRDFAAERYHAFGFSPDGESIVAVTQSGTTQGWPVDVVATAEQLRPRDLTPAEKREYSIWESGEEQALALVERLFAQLILSADVIASLESDSSLSDAVREAAIRFARLHEDNAEALRRTAELIESTQASPAEARDRARLYREAAARLLSGAAAETRTRPITQSRS